MSKVIQQSNQSSSKHTHKQANSNTHQNGKANQKKDVKLVEVKRETVPIQDIPVESSTSLLQKKRKPFIGTIDDADAYLIKSKFIRRGYRIGFQSARSLIKSVFQIHNESFNIWSMVVGVMIFVFLSFYTYTYLTPPAVTRTMNADYKGVSSKWNADHQETISKVQNFWDGMIDENGQGKSLFEEVNIYQNSREKNDDIIRQNLQKSERILDDALQFHLVEKLKDEVNSKHHNPNATLFEGIDEYIKSALYLITHPSQTFIRCKSCFKTFLIIVQRIPQHLQEKVQSLTNSIQMSSQLDYSKKIQHIRALIHYIQMKVQQISMEIQQKIDSSDFDWLLIRNLIYDPSELVVYVTRVPLFIQLAGAIFCLSASAVYHTFKDYSQSVGSFLSRFDYGGISILIAASNTPPIYYTFFCDEIKHWANFYLGLMYFFCFSAFLVMLIPKFNQPKYIVVRGSLFVCCGLLSCLPCFHMEFFLDPIYLEDFHVMPYALGGFLYVFGAILYMMKIPERLKPGHFDLCCFTKDSQLHVLTKFLMNSWVTLNFFTKGAGKYLIRNITTINQLDKSSKKRTQDEITKDSVDKENEQVKPPQEDEVKKTPTKTTNKKATNDIQNKSTQQGKKNKNAKEVKPQQSQDKEEEKKEAVAVVQATPTSELGGDPLASYDRFILELGDWQTPLKDFLVKPTFKKTYEYVKKEYESTVVFPPKHLIFNTFKFVPFSQLRVVIVGQDPYIKTGEAMGLSFSVPKNIKVPPSLKNIYKALENDPKVDFKMPNPIHGDLTKWAQQGVMMLNAILTVREGKSNSHQKQGWEEFTDQVIQVINKQKTGVVFLLWGQKAIDKAKSVDKTRHLVLSGVHPSPLAGTDFVKCKHFSETNEYLVKNSKEPINWNV